MLAKQLFILLSNFIASSRNLQRYVFCNSINELKASQKNILYLAYHLPPSLT